MTACSVPHPEQLIANPCELQSGAVVQRPLDLQFYRVIAVFGIEEDFLVVRLENGRNRHKTRILMERFRETLPVLIETPVACGKPACEFHAREIDEGFFQCAEHWPDYERVYSVE